MILEALDITKEYRISGRKVFSALQGVSMSSRRVWKRQDNSQRNSWRPSEANLRKGALSGGRYIPVAGR